MFFMLRALALGVLGIVILAALWGNFQSFSYLDEDACSLGSVRMKSLWTRVESDGRELDIVDNNGAPAPFPIIEGLEFDVEEDGEIVQSGLIACSVAAEPTILYGVDTGLVVRLSLSGQVINRNAPVDVLTDDLDPDTPIVVSAADLDGVAQWEPAIPELTGGVTGRAFDTLVPFYGVLVLMSLGVIVLSEWHGDYGLADLFDRFRRR